MWDEIEAYKGELQKSMSQHMHMPVSERSANGVKEMAKCWKELTAMQDMMCARVMLSHEAATTWASNMVNEDGTVGPHWSIEETTSVAESIGLKFEHISDWCWWITMNMMYSDYYTVAERFGVNSAEFYAEMAKAFLFDKDGGEPKHKIAEYYYSIVKE